MNIKFCGAAGTVTGSQHLLNINGKKILLDCGMYQGKREDSYKTNKQFLFSPNEIDAIILSHAHIDHSGNLPTIYAKGFKNNIYSTPATKDLCNIMLQDSAYIQQKDVEYVNKSRKKKRLVTFNPLYTVEDAKKVMEQFISVPYKTQFKINGIGENISAKFFDAGHILGSAQVVLEINENGNRYKVGFTGDLGRKNLPILKDPDFMGDVDYLLMESTYGNRLHDNASMMESQLESVINDTVKKDGKIIIPAFSIGRTQDIIYTISEIRSQNRIPDIPVFIDSPLSVNATGIFKNHPECFDTETAELIKNGVNIWNMDNILYIKEAEESKMLNSYNGPCIIVSASGMCENGRILHHLANNIENQNSTILIIGFMAQNTLGRKLVEARDKANAEVNIFGKPYKINAEIKVLNAFSAHADKNEILDYVKNFKSEKLKKIFLIHGELDAQTALKESLLNSGFNNIEIPKRGDEISINN